MNSHHRRLRIDCHGAVQGVGFRPTVFRVAGALQLTGWVLNGPDGVTIEIEGSEDRVAGFLPALRAALPPLARLDGVSTLAVETTGATEFQVIASVPGARKRALVPPDARICPDCLADMDDRADRRWHYPFTTCTNCGPRFSIVNSLPYDRATTSMARFPLCAQCSNEYTDPVDRRFHAEPVCCPECGPALRLIQTDGTEIASGSDAVSGARQALIDGAIVAVHGLGGFQLACRADDGVVVDRLRQRKQRPSKPFALMVRDLETARQLVELSSEARTMVRSARGPIVLARAIPNTDIADSVAPGIQDLGVLLPTTPLHAELMRDAPYSSLVMTSGNRTDEPICRTPTEAQARLANIADVLLVHNREVVRRIDDSVVRDSDDGSIMIRRSRGWVPEPEPLRLATPEPLVALGAHLQVTACVAVANQAFLSQHVGDLDSETARTFLEEVVTGLEEFLAVTAGVIVVDHHPDYPSTWLGERLAGERNARLIRVQHHLAHAAATLAEHDRLPSGEEQALAVALDGTGLGSDGEPWGGEWLTLDGRLRWSRIASLQPLPLVGGELAVREPWRVAVAALVTSGHEGLIDQTPLAHAVDCEKLLQVRHLSRLAGGWRVASGAGRLLEAAAALLGLCSVNRWEGEAAACLEAAATRADDGAEPWPEIAPAQQLPGPALLAAAARRLAHGEEPTQVAAGVHATLAQLIVIKSIDIATQLAVTDVAFGGGCLVNRILRRRITAGLARAGIEALLPRRIPPGDGGLAYGQAVLAAASLATGIEPVELPFGPAGDQRSSPEIGSMTKV